MTEKSPFIMYHWNGVRLITSPIVVLEEDETPNRKTPWTEPKPEDRAGNLTA